MKSLTEVSIKISEVIVPDKVEKVPIK